jgi:CBS domain containing-hemolysin-like protein
MAKKDVEDFPKEESKKIDDWNFTTKYQMLSPELKLLHQVVLLRSDVDSLVYILLSLIPLYLAIRFNISFAALTITILLYGFYRHLQKRSNLKYRFEHASTFGA